MAELALYRKWRSKNFEELVGQPHITQTLRNAVISGKIAHAYLFSGPRGTGKTSTAKILAKALNCEKGPTPDPCNECAICKGINAGTVLDCLEIDAASNRGIDEIRDLREKVKFAPTQCRTKVYIIDEVHMLTTEAFNALLKTLEEPPPQTVFILCTTEPHKLLPTVLSRCQRFDFNRIDSKTILLRLEEIAKHENLKVEEGVFPLIVASAEGSLRDALSLLDQLRAFCPNGITKEEALVLLGHTPLEVVLHMIELIGKGDLKDLLIFIQGTLHQGIDSTQLIRDLLLEMRKILLFKVAPEVLDLTEEERHFIEERAPSFQTDELYRMLRIVADLRQELRYSQHPQLSTEMAFIRLLKAQWEPNLEGLKRRVESIEKSGEPLQASPRVAKVQKEPLGSLEPVSFLPKEETAARQEASVSVTLNDIQNGWPELVEKLRVSRNALFSILQEAKPIKLTGNVLTLSMAYAFHKTKVDQKKMEIQNLLKERFLMSLTLEAQFIPVDHTAFVEEATELFPGTVVIGEGS